jgi:hypothetical protein
MCNDCVNGDTEITLTSVSKILMNLLDGQNATHDLVSTLNIKLTNQESIITCLRQELDDLKQQQLEEIINHQNEVTPIWPLLTNNNNKNASKSTTVNNNNAGILDKSRRNAFHNTADTSHTKYNENKKPKQNKIKTADQDATPSSDVSKGVESTNRLPLPDRQPFVLTSHDTAQYQRGNVNSGKPNNEQSSSQQKPSVEPAEDDYTEVKKKKQRRKAEVIGKGNDTSYCSLKGAKKKAHLFLGRLEITTTAESVKTYICKLFNDEHNEDVEVIKLDTKGKSASFRASIPLEKLDKIKNGDLWPLGTIITRFYFKKQNFQQLELTEPQT